MIIIKIILIIIIYILITLIISKIYFKQFDYFTKYGYECKACTICEDIEKATISTCVKPDDTICADIYTPIYVTGYAESGSHGNNDGTTSTTFNLQLVNIYQDIVYISMASRSSLFLTKTGDVYSCGINFPNLGLGPKTTNVLTPEKIEFPDSVTGKIKQVSISDTHSLFLTIEDDVYFCGFSANGADGTNVLDEYNIPKKLNFFNKPSIQSVNYISTSNSSCIVIVNDGDVYYTGQNNFNKFNDNSNRLVINEFTQNTYLYYNSIKISEVYQELSCTMFLTTNNEVYVAGKNYDRFGFVDYQENTIQKIPFFDENEIRIIQISIGKYHTLFLTSDYKVYGCGRTNNGQLGLGDLGTEAKDYTIIEPKKLTFFDDLNVIKVVAGAFHSLFLTKSGFVYGSGKNDSGQFGIQNVGSTTTYYNPIKITTKYKKNIFTFSNLDGDKSYSMFINKLAYDKDPAYNCNADYYEEDDFCSTCTECQDVGKYHYEDCTRNRDTICEDKYTLLYVTGKNLDGELGETSDTHIPIQLTNLKKNIQQISICNNSSMFLTNLGEVYACGNNTNGKLGLGNTLNENIITKITTFDTENVIIKQVSVGFEHCLFLTKTGSVYFSGKGDQGRKGLGEDDKKKNDEIYPIKLTFFDNIGKIRYVYAGDKTSFCVTESGDLYCCGYNTEGQLGLGTSISLGYSYIEHGWILNTEISDIKQIVNYGTVTTFLTNDGNVYSCTYIAQWSLGDHGLGEPRISSNIISTPERVNIDQKIIQLARGNQHTLFLTETGQVYSCGQNGVGQLGFSGGGISTPRLINSLSGINIVKVAAGTYHSLFLTNLGEVYGCGNDINGAIGINENNYIYQPEKIVSLNIIKDIYANSSEVYAGEPTGESSIFISKLVYDIPDGSDCDSGFYEDDEALRCNSCTVCKDIFKLHVSDCTITSDTECSDMPLYSTFDPTNDSEFLCLAGYYAGYDEQEGKCLPCQPGWYKTEVGNEPCQPCDSYMTSPEGSTQMSDCKCIMGYESDGSKCTECGAGWYKTEVGNEACEPCEEGTFKEFAGSGECEQCPSNMTSVSGSTECVCDEGFESLAGAPCTACQPGHYKYEIGPGPCQSCGQTEYLAPSGLCEALPSNSDSNDDNTDFICRDDYYKSGDLCKPKPSNADINEDKTDFICRNGFYKSADSCLDCKTCEKGWGLTDCNIDGSNGSGTCTACQDGYYNDFPRKAPCKTLPRNSRAKDMMSNGVLVNYDWVCKNNYYLKVTGNKESCEICLSCESGKELMGCGDEYPGYCVTCHDTMWKSGNNRGSCKDRPPNSQIIQIDGLNIGIECDEGYRLHGESCVPDGCEDGKYQSGSQCIPCASCDSGFELTDCNVDGGRGTCNKCPDNMWKMGRNRESCRELPLHSNPLTMVRQGETVNIGFLCNYGYVKDGYTCVRNQ